MSGYVGDVAYTLGFYRELAPSYLNATCVLNGYEGLKVSDSLRYCELGCGRGYGTVLLAAANPNIEFVGIDFNPSHIAEARGLASSAGIKNITFFEMGFGDAARSGDQRLSEFNIVGIHGVYSWVMPEVRNEIHQFLRDKLLAGGVVYNSYNTLPGWTTAAPIQHLIMELSQRSSRDSIAVVNDAFALLKTLADHKSAFIAQNPGVKARLERMSKQDKAYLVHEFVNAGWEPLYVTQAMKNLSECKLTYVGSASLLENRTDLCVPKDLLGVVRDAPDAGMRELLKDYIVNKQFRRDVYVKGPQQLSVRDQRQRISELIFSRTLMSKTLPEKFALPIGEIVPKPGTISALLNSVGERPTSGADLLASGQRAGILDSDTVLILLLLISAGALSPARPDHDKVDRTSGHRLNSALMQASAAADTHRFLASPVLGSAIAAPFVDRIVGALAADRNTSDTDVAASAFDRLRAAGQSFRRDGQALAKSPENIAEIAKMVREFREVRLPVWRSLALI